MVVGVLRLTLYIQGASSLKDKRQVVRKVVDRLRSRFNVTVAEVGDNDIWQRAVIGIGAVSNDRSFVNEVLDKCARDAGNIAEILNREMEIETYSEMSPDWSTLGGSESRGHDAPSPAERPEGGLRVPPRESHLRESPSEEAPDADAAEAGWLREEDIE